MISIFIEVGHVTQSQPLVFLFRNKPAVTEQGQSTVCSEPQVVFMVFKNRPYQVCWRSTLHIEFLKLAIDKPADAVFCTDPDSSGVVLVNSINPVIRQTVAYRVPSDHSIAELIQSVFCSHPDGTIPALHHAAHIILDAAISSQIRLHTSIFIAVQS